jgi:hypothetical protein
MLGKPCFLKGKPTISNHETKEWLSTFELIDSIFCLLPNYSKCLSSAALLKPTPLPTHRHLPSVQDMGHNSAPSSLLRLPSSFRQMLPFGLCVIWGPLPGNNGQTNSTKQGDYVARKQECLREHRRKSGAELCDGAQRAVEGEVTNPLGSFSK